MTRRPWFLPHDADLLGMLGAQAKITVDGFDALVHWADGAPVAGEQVRACEHRADTAKRELWRALRVAFSPPMDAEDLFTLSADLDEVLNGAKDLVREMEVMAMEPDAPMLAMVGELRDAVANLAAACRAFAEQTSDPTEYADAAIHHQRKAEHLYRGAMSALIGLDSVHEVVGRREAYRRLSRVGELVHRVADRVWYATVKEA
ncbi:MAG: DUF47 domain-containing protein [Acidimicrobiia bacterium]